MSATRASPGSRTAARAARSFRDDSRSVCFRSRERSSEGCQRARGCGATDTASFVSKLSGVVPPRAGFMAYPQRFRGFPAPGLSPGGCGEPRIVATRVTPRVPDFCSPPSMQDASRSTPQAGRDGMSVHAVWRAGTSSGALVAGSGLWTRADTATTPARDPQRTQCLWAIRARPSP